MPSSTVNICVLTLVLLSFQQISHSKPHSREERGIVKDYFIPDSLLFSSDKFEKGENGKYYLKKSAHRSDSEVKYSSPEGAEDGNNRLQGDMKSDDVETVIHNSDKVPARSPKNEPLKEEVTEKVTLDVSPTPPIIEEVTVVKEVINNPKVESVVEEATKKVEINKDKAPFKPVNPKFVVPSKPDSKDEIPLKTHLPPIDLEEKVDAKITIGQVPDLYSRLMPVPGTFRVPILIPVRQISYGAVKVMPLTAADVSDRLPLPPSDVSGVLPLPPSDVSGVLPLPPSDVSGVLPLPPADVSDRLPLPYEDDIVGEGAHESESEEVSQPIAEEKKDGAYHLGNPLAMGIPLPALSFRTLLKDLKETDKSNSEKQTKVVDVLGKKFLMQSNVMKYPSGDNSHMYLRFLSVKPLEEIIKPIVVSKEVAVEESAERSLEDAARKELKDIELKKEESMAKEKEKEIKIKEDREMESEVEKKEEIMKEPEVFKAEETEIKIDVEEEVPKEVILENIDKPELNIDEVDMKETKAVESAVEVKNEDKFMAELEKTESQVVETKVNSELTEESVSEEDDQELETQFTEEDKSFSKETYDEKKIKTIDALLKKGDAGMEMEMANKKDFFLVEKKKKFMKENEEIKPKKKIEEKKQKKCKCEEKDSDSDDDDE